MEKKVNQNIIDMKEIYIEADCIASCDRIRKGLGSRFVPLLLTSRIEPMGVKAIRKYYSGKKEIPNVGVLTIDEFIDVLKNPNEKASDGIIYIIKAH